MIYWPQTPAEQELLISWAASRIGARSLLYPSVAAVRNSRGDMQAVVIFHEYRKTDVQLSFAADTPRWATRSNIMEILAYPFVAMGVLRITSMTDKTNRRARQMLEFAGFRLEGVLRDATEKGPLCLYGMTRSDFARASERYGKTKRTGSDRGRDRMEPATEHRAGVC